MRSGKGLLFVNPDNLSRADGKGEPGASRDRKNLTVQLSTDDGRTWPRKAVIEPGAAAYADLAVARDGTIVCLYEKGRPFESLVLARFNREWISQPRTSP